VTKAAAAGPFVNVVLWIVGDRDAHSRYLVFGLWPAKILFLARD
jgi:hypothetical protein